MRTRREFLKYALISAATLTSGKLVRSNARMFIDEAFAANGREFLVVCDSPKSVHFNDDPGLIAVTNPGSLRALDVEEQKILSIDLPFLGHTATQNPKYPGQAIVFEKWGLRGALVDLEAQTVLANAKAAPNNIFFGHAAFSANGNFFVASEDNYDRSGGQLIVRDAQTMQILSQFPSYGTRPHECRTLDSKTLVSVNTGSKTENGSIVWIDWASGKLLNKIQFDAAAHGHYAHVDFSHDQWMCICSAANPNAGKIAFISPAGSILFPKLPAELVAKMSGQALSIAFLGNSGLVAVTLEEGGMICLIDYKTQRLISVAFIDYPNGIVASTAGASEEPRFIVSLGKARNLVSVTMPKQAYPIITPIYENFGGNGAHLTRIFI